MKIVSCVLMLTRLDEQGIDVIYNRRMGGWVWFNREALRMTFKATGADPMLVVHGPFPSCWECGSNALAMAPVEEAVAA
jgi:hypothetical protein